MKNTDRQFVEGKDRMVIHMRQADDSMVSVPPLVPKVEPEMHGGGEYLVSTINDYAQLLLTVLNGGRHPTLGVQILGEDTVKNYLFKDLLPPNVSHEPLGKIPSTAPPLTNVAQMMPGIKQSWSAGLLLNDEDLPKGRKAGSGAWAGLGNLYYFIDPASEKLAFFATNLFPFMDPASLELFDEMERAMYGHEAGSDGRNHGPWEGVKAAL
jgi:methyl acetate hydrolase